MRLSFGGFLSVTSFVLVFLFVMTGHGTTEIVTTNAPQVAGASTIVFRETGDEFIDAINKVRVDNNIAPVYRSEGLINVATSRTSDMVMNSYYSHSNSDGKNYGSYLPFLPKYSCENLNLAQLPDVDISIQDWLNSSQGHRECLLDSRVQFLGYNVVNFDSQKTEFITVAIFSN